MDTQRITEDISKKKNQLSALEGEISSLQVDIKNKQRGYSEALVAVADRSKRPASLETRKRFLSDANAECQALEGAADILRQEIEALEIEKVLASLHGLHVATFERSLSRSQQSTQAIKDIGAGLSEKVSELNGAAGSLMTEIETCIGAVMAVHRHVGADVSLQAFMAGEIQRTDTPDHEEVLTQIGARLQSIVRDVIPIDPKPLGTLLERLEMLHQWRLKVLGFEPLALMKNRQSLVGKPATKTKPGVSEFSPPPYSFVLKNRDKFAPADVEKAEVALLAGAKRFKDEAFARYYPNERA